MRRTSGFSAKIIVGLLAGAGVAACSLVGDDVDRYNSGKGASKEDTNAAPDAGEADGAAANGGQP